MFTDIEHIKTNEDFRDAVLDIVLDAHCNNTNKFYDKMQDYNDKGWKMSRDKDHKRIPALTDEELLKKWGGDKVDKAVDSDCFPVSAAENMNLSNKAPTLKDALRHILKDAVESNSYGLRDLLEI